MGFKPNPYDQVRGIDTTEPGRQQTEVERVAPTAFAGPEVEEPQQVAEPEEAEEVEETGEEFDPSDHNVDEVKAYVADNPDEVGAVLAAEKAGKNRSTLVEALEGSDEDGDDE